MNNTNLYWIIGGGACLLVLLVVGVFMGGDQELERRLKRVAPQQNSIRKINVEDRLVRRSQDSSIGFLNQLTRMMPNPDKLRGRLARTGENITLGEYLLMNLVSFAVFFMIFHTLRWSSFMIVTMSIAVGLGLPHFAIGYIGNKRIKKFLATFPEAIDTICRGLRAGLPLSECVISVSREMRGPIAVEFHRISNGVQMGQSMEVAMWDVAHRIDVPEFRFLIIAMAIQKETGGNLAETLGNLADLIRRRRQLRLKIKAMSAEAKASALIIGSLPFIMFALLMVVSPSYMAIMFEDGRGKIILGGALFWMSIGWLAMAKMVQFEI